MEIKVGALQLPEKISFNYEELKGELEAKVSMYETMVYTDDQIKDAKTDKANLNKLKKALNDERIRREKEYMEPFNDFKSKVNEIISIIDKPIAVIDRQVKAYEEAQKEAKYREIHDYFMTRELPDDMPELFDKIFSDKWLNSSTSVKSIREEINSRLEQIEMDVRIIEDLPEFGFEAMEEYKSSLNIRNALNEANRLSEVAKRKAEQKRLAEEAEARRKAEQERLAEEAKKQTEFIPPVADDTHFEEAQAEATAESCENFVPDFAKKLEKKWVPLKVNITSDDEVALLRFLEERRIEFVVL